MDSIHKILTGQTEHRWQLVVAGLVVLVWIAIDFHQYIGFLMEPACK